MATGVGIALLVLAAHVGASVADFALDVGSAIALSGVLWWCASRIRGEPRGKTDYSALIFLLVVGGGGVAWSLDHGKPPQEAYLTLGVAFATIWLFTALEHQFVFSDKNRLPLIVKIPLAPFYPFYWLVVRSVAGIPDFALPSDHPQPLNINSLVTERSIEADLDAFDRDSGYRDADIRKQKFDPSPREVGRTLGVTLPDSLVQWVNVRSGSTDTLPDGRIRTIWPWAGIQMHPISLPEQIVVFADVRRRDPRTDETIQEVLAVDLRPGTSSGSVVSAQLDPGRQPTWQAGATKTVAASFAEWEANETASPEAEAV